MPVEARYLAIEIYDRLLLFWLTLYAYILRKSFEFFKILNSINLEINKTVKCQTVKGALILTLIITWLFSHWFISILGLCVNMYVVCMTLFKVRRQMINKVTGKRLREE